MMHRIYKMTEKAIEEGLGWDDAIWLGEIETVEEFEGYEDAVEAFEEGGYDTDFYGVA